MIILVIHISQAKKKYIDIFIDQLFTKCFTKIINIFLRCAIYCLIWNRCKWRYWTYDNCVTASKNFIPRPDDAPVMTAISAIFPPKFLYTDFYTVRVCPFSRCHNWLQISGICEDIPDTFHILPISRQDILLRFVLPWQDIFLHRYRNRYICLCLPTDFLFFSLSHTYKLLELQLPTLVFFFL